MTHETGHSDTKVERARAALAGLARGFEADDYAFHILSVNGSTLQVRIEAGPKACAECLVPESAMSRMIMATLPPGIGISDVSIQYPEKTG